MEWVKEACLIGERVKTRTGDSSIMSLPSLFSGAMLWHQPRRNPDSFEIKSAVSARKEASL